MKKPVLQINVINCGKRAKNNILNNTRLENKLLVLKGSYVIIIQKFWMLVRLVNGTMDIVYNMIWEDGVEDPFAIMSAVILVAVNNYAGPASIVVNGIYVVPVLFVEGQ